MRQKSVKFYERFCLENSENFGISKVRNRVGESGFVAFDKEKSRERKRLLGDLCMRLRRKRSAITM